MIYIVKMDNVEADALATAHKAAPNRVRLVGPFASHDAAAAWGRSPKNNPHDNPCWQVVDLPRAEVTFEASEGSI